jgi:hypothetical protein
MTDMTTEREARLLGLCTAVVVAIGWDSLILAWMALAVIQAIDQGRDPLGMDWVPAVQILLEFTVVAVLAAAPGGWLLGPAAISSIGHSRKAVIAAMGLGAVLIGDVVLSLGFALGPTSGDNAFGPASLGSVASLIVIGGVVVGPFVLAFVTLPSAVIWTELVGRAWSGRHQAT